MISKDWCRNRPKSGLGPKQEGTRTVAKENYVESVDDTGVKMMRDELDKTPLRVNGERVRTNLGTSLQKQRLARAQALSSKAPRKPEEMRQ